MKSEIMDKVDKHYKNTHSTHTTTPNVHTNMDIAPPLLNRNDMLSCGTPANAAKRRLADRSLPGPHPY